MQQHPAAVSERELLKHCEITRTRRSGPGGQHRNKVETAIVIKHIPTGTRAEANERRSQEQNRRVAIRRLRVNLALVVRTVVSDARMPSEAWMGRCRGARMTVSVASDDFATLLAEAIDFIAASDYDVASAASRLGISNSQLVKLLKLDDRALQLVNQHREEKGLHPLS